MSTTRGKTTVATRAAELPIYARGVDREKAEALARLFIGRYQPPIECAHRPGRMTKRVAGVRGMFQTCED